MSIMGTNGCHAGFASSKLSLTAIALAMLVGGRTSLFAQTASPASATVILEEQLLEIHDSRTELLRVFTKPLLQGETLHTVFSVEQRNDVLVEVTATSVRPDATVVRLRTLDPLDKSVRLDRTLEIPHGDVVMVSLAESPLGNRRIGLRLAVDAIGRSGVREYSGVVPEFGVIQGVATLDREEILAQGSIGISAASSDPLSVQLICLEDPRIGRVCLSYRRFPGSQLAGYVDGRKMVVVSGRHVVEWLSTAQDILPAGTWELYAKSQSSPGAPVGRTRVWAERVNLDRR